MKWILIVLLSVAAGLLIVPALFEGVYWYALIVAAAAAGAFALVRSSSKPKLSDLLLIATSALIAFSQLLGIHPLFAIVSISLFISAWNIAHRFGHLDRVPVTDRAKQRFTIQMITRSLIPSIAIGLLLTACLYIRIPMSFGLGLGLSAAIFLNIALFIGFSHSAHKRAE